MATSFVNAATGETRASVWASNNRRDCVSAKGYPPMKYPLKIGVAIATVVLFGGLALAAPPDDTSPQPVKAKHDGGINDLDAIGNRNVGCGRGVEIGRASCRERV